MKRAVKFYQKRKNSFRFKVLAGTLAIAVILLGTITWIWYGVTSRNAIQAAERYVGSVLERLNGSFETMLRDIDHLVTCAAIDKTHVINSIKDRSQQTPQQKLEGNQAVQDAMVSIYQFKTYMEGLLITTPEGNYYRMGTMLPHNELIAQPWFHEVEMEGNRSVVIGPHSNGTDQVLSVARNIRLGDRQLGVIKADLNCSILDDCYGTPFRDLGQVYILDLENGKMVYPGEDEIDRELAADLLNGTNYTGSRGSFYDTVDGQKSLVIYNRSNMSGWVTAGVVPKSALVQDFRSTSLMILGICTLVSAVALLLLYRLLSAQVDNVMKLCGAVQQIEENGMVLQQVVHSGDEIEVLQGHIANMVGRLRKLMDNIRQEQREKRELELKILRNQINPHFLHNTLNTIKYLAVLQNADNIAEVTDNLSVLLQTNMRPEKYLTVAEEVRNIRCYLNIQMFKYSGKFRYSIGMEPEVEQCRILKMLIQPVLENALKHGIEPLQTMGLVRIRLYREDDYLLADITDNGVGMSEEMRCSLLERPEESQRIGMRSVISRIKLYYGKPYGVEIETGSMGTRIVLKLPILEQKEHTEGDHDVPDPDC